MDEGMMKRGFLNILKSLEIRVTRKSFALDQLDIKLLPYLNFKDGFFIEAGAYDGMNQSNTLYFERYMNWKGILIEPIPEIADKCRKNRTKCIVENCALVPIDYYDNHIEMYYCGLMSLVRGAMKTEYEELCHINKGVELQENVSDFDTLTVPAKNLTSILEYHRIPKIDFFSLDVEGYELDVLKGLDFRRYAPTYMLIEARYRNEIFDYLKPFYKPLAELSHHDILFKFIGSE